MHTYGQLYTCNAISRGNKEPTASASNPSPGTRPRSPLCPGIPHTLVPVSHPLSRNRAATSTPSPLHVPGKGGGAEKQVVRGCGGGRGDSVERGTSADKELGKAWRKGDMGGELGGPVFSKFVVTPAPDAFATSCRTRSNSLSFHAEPATSTAGVGAGAGLDGRISRTCLLYTSPSPRD